MYMQSAWRKVLTAVGVVGATVGLHEAAHALVAAHQGGTIREVGIGFGPSLMRVQVRTIPIRVRALPIGGYAAVEVDHLHPRQRIGMLLAGPLMNLAIGSALLLGLRRQPAVALGRGRRVGLTGFVGTMSALIRAAEEGPGAVARLAGAVNVGLGVMNLLPVYPLDGGHVVMNVMEAQGVPVRIRAAFAGITAAAFFWLVQMAVAGDLQQLVTTRWAGGPRQ